ncbi:TetR/AcrR family transcriptional regulator [Agrococcus sp. SGAir0287]|uniref:TetR/AcrR family transcriptional regulator n=1 Tax=Agrococcus sp. SGAir0287 TaxID=2070347 RepID=UPI0010CD6B7F|nr:TetR/AcrR family transcriptional regulator [Agrococcus sp. SGAir0287]QCR20654.1 TetR family transcriptional regulator [Agrococcus sp. SGAir0287]
MARNDGRRRALGDAGLAILAREGARGLTHRAVDAEADVPVGTTSNYCRSRAQLVALLVARIGERLAPDPDVQAALAARAPDRDRFAAHVREIVARLTASRETTLALLELRLEAARRPEVAEALGGWMRDGFAGDVAFNAAAGLPGGAFEIALLHYAIDGLMLDRLTTSIDPGIDVDAAVDALVDRLLPESP